jgi:phage shock protein A
MKDPSKTSESEKNTGATKVQLDQFKKLLEQLESSKMRQQRQRSVEGRRDIYSQGLASMMSNF